MKLQAILQNINTGYNLLRYEQISAQCSPHNEVSNTVNFTTLIFARQERQTQYYIVTTPTQPQHNLNLTQLSWV